MISITRYLVVATLENVSDTAYGKLIWSFCRSSTACVDDVSVRSLALGGFGTRGARAQLRRPWKDRPCPSSAAHCFRSNIATGPTPWVQQQPPSSSSIGTRNCRLVRTPMGIGGASNDDAPIPGVTSRQHRLGTVSQCPCARSWLYRPSTSVGARAIPCSWGAAPFSGVHPECESLASRSAPI